MSDTCKFCGSAPAVGAVSAVFIPRFQCGTEADYSFRSEECKERTLPRYEALFPIPPLSTEPITAAVCERLGLSRNVSPLGLVGFLGACGTYVFVLSDGEHRVSGDPEIKTAGQLACLIAARKGAVK